MGRATSGASDGERQAPTIGAEALTVPFKYRKDYRELRITGLDHEGAKEQAMSTMRARPEEHVKQLKENPFGKSEPTWGPPKKSPKDIVEVPHHPKNERSEPQPRLCNREAKR